MTLSTDDLQIREILASKNSSACEDCFLGFLVWREKYGFKLCSDCKSFVIRIEKNNSFYFPFSSDKTAVKETVQKLLEKKDLCFERLTAEQVKFLEEEFPLTFEIEEDRGNSDYIYSIEALSSLAGKKLSKKRNHINGFLSQYNDWSVKMLDSENIAEVLDFADKWYLSRLESEGKNSSLDFEQKAMHEFLPCLNQIGADGIVLYVNGKVAAFTAGQRISPTVYDTVFEKASDEVKGSYNMINREFAKILRNKYPDLLYINRESDVNHPGLRQAKLSYMPERILSKYIARVKK